MLSTPIATSKMEVATSTFPPSERVRIADLEQAHVTAAIAGKYVEATISLVWPYSSSTRKFSVLLSEYDSGSFKTRRQVKVTFHNGAAKAAQESKIGIGDTIRLSLEASELTKRLDEISTPGKRLENDVEFRRQLTLEMSPGKADARVVHYVWNGTPSPEPTPAVNGVVTELKGVTAVPSKISIDIGTPAVRKKLRLSSGSYFDSSLDPFADDREYVYGRSAKRTKFARRSSAWMYVNDDAEDETTEEAPTSPNIDVSPTKAVANGFELSLASSALEQTITEPEPEPPSMAEQAAETVDLITPVEERTRPELELEMPKHIAALDQTLDDRIAMPPPQLPTTPVRRAERHIVLSDDESDETSTPYLHPLASPGLPMVSPFVTRFGADIGYFSAAGSTSELDASSVSTRERNASVSNSGESVEIVEAHSYDNGIIDSDDDGGATQDQQQVSNLEDVVEDEDMYGAPEFPQPLHETQKEPSKAALSALDMLEEFINSSTIELEPAVEEAALMSPSVASGPASRDDESDIIEQSPAVQSLDGALDAQEPSPASYHGQVTQEGISSLIQQQPLHVIEFPESPVKDDVESSSGDAEVLEEDTVVVHSGVEVVVSGSKSISPEVPIEIQDQESDTGSKPKEERGDGTPDEVTIATSGIVMETAQPQDSNLLPTPDQTQEGTSLGTDINQDKRLPINEVSNLPTPDQTQLQENLPLQSSSFQQPEEVRSPKGEIIVDQVIEKTTEEQELQPQSSAPEEMTPHIHRRISQRLTRKSAAPEPIETPYFTPKRQIESSGTPAHERSQLPQSTQALPSSPTTSARRRSSRLQRNTASPEVARSHEQEEIQEEPLSPIEEDARTQRPKTPGLSTLHSYYPALGSLEEYFGAETDIIAICVEDSTPAERAKRGPKDWHTTLRVADESSDSSAKSKQAVQIFRHNKTALPNTRRGDVVLLRHFKVQTEKHKPLLLSTDISAWAVFDRDSEGHREPAISGPVPEYGENERTHVQNLMSWWRETAQGLFPDQPKKASTRIPNGQSAGITSVQNEPEDKGVNGNTEYAPPSPRRTRRQRTPTIDADDAAETSAVERTEHLVKSAKKHRKRKSNEAQDLLQNLPTESEPSAHDETEDREVTPRPVSPRRTRRQHTPTAKAVANGHDEDDADADAQGRPHAEPSPRNTRKHTRATTPQLTVEVNGDEALASIEKPPKSPVRTRLRAKLAEPGPGAEDHEDEHDDDHDEDEDGVEAEAEHTTPKLPVPKPRKRKATPNMTPSRRQPSRRAKTPRENTNGEVSSSSPVQAQSQSLPQQAETPPAQASGSPVAQTRGGRVTRSASTAVVQHELRDGFRYVDDGRQHATVDPEAVHELRDGMRYADQR